ncbi:hypothetical protein Tco_1104569 [Tanacetum coccineum]
MTTPTQLPTIETTNPLSNLPDFASVFRLKDRITALEKEVSEIKKDPLHTQVTSLVDEHLDTRRFFLKSKSYLTAPEHRECYDGLEKSYALDQDFFYSYDVYTLKRGRKHKDKDEDPSAGSDRGLKRRKTSKDSEPTTDPKKKDSTSGSSKGTQSEPRSSRKSVQLEEPVFEVADSDMPRDKEGNLGDNKDEPRKETASRSDWFKKPTPTQEPTDPDWNVGKTTKEECYKALSEKLDWENPKGGDYLFDLSKPLPLITRGKRQRVPFEFFINNDLKYLQGGISTMTYTTSTTKTKAAKYDPPGIKDKVPNIWSPFMQSRGYLFAKRILAVTSCLESSEWDISGDFRINDIEDMLILVVQNWLTNLSGDDVADFTIALRMFTRSLVIQNPYKDPQGFIYVDDIGRNRLMHSDELYKFSDGTLTRLLSSLEDITKNINMTYLPKRRWSTLETKRSHFMIKGGGDINKMQKEGGMMGLGEIFDKVLKLKKFKKDALLKLFKINQIKKGMSMSVQKSTSLRDGKVYKMAKRRLILVDEFQEAQ